MGRSPNLGPKSLKQSRRASLSLLRNINKKHFIGQAALSWDPKDQPFANISAQRCNDTILQVTIEVSIQRRRRNENKLDRLAEFSFVNMIVICAGNLEPDCENQSQDPKHLHRLWGLLQVF